ncbi:MAG: cysteine--tRNA ligase [Candidatus ainarchaeum sp.]|nr:cysteine--tRNA ligase [Candidatus ainarchaeum sp.]
MLRVFNTLSRKKEAFVPLKGRRVGLYACGPSVYQQPHVGNYRTYVFEDVFKRFLEWKGYRVKHVQNITDVENKAIIEARIRRKTLKQLTAHYAKVFSSETRALNIIPADFTPKATDNIPEIAEFVCELRRNGFAYELNGDWYYAISRFPKYGMLSRLKVKPHCKPVGFDDYYKWQAGDFVLWRHCRKADRGACWDSPLGRGRPGWSIECSAIGRKYLGDRYDVKMGGVDNVFAHHENEIAQSWGVSRKVFAKYFIHVKHLLVDGVKMSKSLGNIVCLDDARARGIEPLALRLLYLTSHYRRRLNFTWKRAKEAQSRLDGCRECVKKLKKTGKAGAASRETLAAVKTAREGFVKAMEDDLDTPRALESACGLVFWSLEKTGKGGFSGGDARAVRDALADFDRVLGLGLF